jgi:hypothetical protein
VVASDQQISGGKYAPTVINHPIHSRRRDGGRQPCLSNVHYGQSRIRWPRCKAGTGSRGLTVSTDTGTGAQEARPAFDGFVDFDIANSGTRIRGRNGPALLLLHAVR